MSCALMSYHISKVGSPSVSVTLDPQGGCLSGLNQFPSLYAGVKLFLPLKAATVNYPHSWRTILFAGNNTQSCQTLKRFSVPYSPLLTDQPPHTAVLPLSLSTGQMSWANCVF